jgi:Protein of unknown function (DUF4031)
MVFVDNNMRCLRSRNWRYATVCHLTSDSLHDLHEFAARIGLARCWFQWKRGSLPHYDLSPNKRRTAVAAGAIELGRKEFVRLIRAWRGSSKLTPCGILEPVQFVSHPLE